MYKCTILYYEYNTIQYSAIQYSINYFSRKKFGKSIVTATVEFCNKTESFETDTSFEEINCSGAVTPTDTGNSVPGV